MGSALLTESGRAKDVRNSHRVSSSPCQSGGMDPDSSSDADRDRVEGEFLVDMSVAAWRDSCGAKGVAIVAEEVGVDGVFVEYCVPDNV